MKIKHQLLLTHGLLALLAVFIIIANVLALNYILTDASFVNHAGKLRAKTYRLAHLSNSLTLTEDISAKELYRKSLLDEIEFYSTLLSYVKYGDNTLMISSIKHQETLDRISQIERQWEEKYKTAFIAVFEHEHKKALDMINSEINSFVDDINTMVTAYSLYSRNKVKLALSTNAILMFIIVITASYSFITTNNKIRKPMSVLVNELTELSLIDKQFAEQFKGSRGNEIGELRNYFNEMMFDSLTRVYNRKAGLSKLQQIVLSADKWKGNFSVCFLDINGLKQVNDLLGHKYGDELIVSTINIIKETIREGDFVIRLGGDEFLIVFINADEKIAERVLQRIQEKYNSINETENRKYLISISHGIITYNHLQQTGIDSLIKVADEKMYIKKRQIKNDPKFRVIRD